MPDGVSMFRSSGWWFPGPRSCRHEPFQFHVGTRPANLRTFCVAREPLERLVSEFNQRVKLEHHGHKAVMRNPAAKAGGCPTAEDVNRWIEEAVTDFAHNRFAYDCHLLPTSIYAQACTHIIPYDKDLERLGKFLTAEMAINVSFSRSKSRALTHHNTKLNGCSAHAGNVTARVREIVHKAYAADYALYFGAEAQLAAK